MAVCAAPVALGIGLLANLGAPDGAAVSALVRLAVLLALTGLLALVVGLFASLGRGYLAGFGGVIGVVVAPQVAIVVGAGSWFPWSVSAVWAIAALNTALGQVPAWHILAVPLAAALSAGATLAWWHASELH